MSSSLYGIYNAHRSILLNQAAINVINNNISNINTPGYSKQRLELSQDVNVGLTADPISSAQAGMGAVIDNISRNRETYLDTYYREENTSLNYYKELQTGSQVVEDIINELNDTGLTNAFSQFYTAAQQLSTNPTDSINRNVFIQNAVDLADRFNNIYSRLDQERTTLVGNNNDLTSITTSNIKLSCDDLNTKLASITELNHTIAISTAQGMTPNSVMDERDKLIDEISSYIPIDIKNKADNQVSISIGGNVLVNGSQQLGRFNVVLSGDDTNPATVQIVGDTSVANANSLLTSGKLGAVLSLGGSNPDELNIYNIMQGLNTLAVEFAREVNTIQRGGQYMDVYDETNGVAINPGVLAPVTSPDGSYDPFDIFIESSSINSQADYSVLTAGNIRVNQAIISDPFKIATASATAASNETGDGSNALKIAQIRDGKLSGLGYTKTESYLNTLVGKVGIEIKSISDRYDSQNAILQQVENRRESATGVNLDEELTDLVKYQRAFEATARVMNIVSEQLQKIVNLGE